MVNRNENRPTLGEVLRRRRQNVADNWHNPITRREAIRDAAYTTVAVTEIGVIGYMVYQDIASHGSASRRKERENNEVAVVKNTLRAIRDRLPQMFFVRVNRTTLAGQGSFDDAFLVLNGENNSKVSIAAEAYSDSGSGRVEIDWIEKNGVRTGILFTTDGLDTIKTDPKSQITNSVIGISPDDLAALQGRLGIVQKGTVNKKATEAMVAADIAYHTRNESEPETYKENATMEPYEQVKQRGYFDRLFRALLR